MSSDSMDLVLAVFREPARIAEMRDRPLPDDVAGVIRLAAGENQALESAQDSTGESAETLLEASIFFLQQILFAPGADSYRVLGAASNIEQSRLRENYRWLMKWLHPDRNQDGWEAVYADRVNIAWQDLKTPDRRADYDLRNAVTPAASVSTEMALRPRGATAVASGPILSGSTVKRLPAIVLGTLGIAAAAVIGLMYWAQTQTQRQLSSHRENAISASEAVPAAPESATAVAVSPSAPIDPPNAQTSAIGVQWPEVSALSPPSAPAVPDPGSAELQTGVAANAAFAVASAVASSQGGASEALVAALNSPDQDSAAPHESATASRFERNDGQAEAGASARNLVPADAGEVAKTEAQARADLLARAEAQARANALAQAEAKLRADALAKAEAQARTEALARAQARSRADALTQARQTEARPAPAPTQPRPSSSPVAASAVGSVASEAPAAIQSAPMATPQPLAARPKNASAASPIRVPAEADARALIREFASAYAAGDLQRFDQLFNGSRFGIPARESMRSRFRSTEMRFLEIDQLRLTRDSQSTRARARYRDTYVPRGERRAVTETGTIEWVILLDSAGTARIAEMARGS
jgi:hypothetical protein